MMDPATNRPVHVSDGGDAGPYVMLPVDHLDALTTALDAKAVSYWVDAEAISIDGKPPIVVVNLARGSDATAVQSILDNIN